MSIRGGGLLKLSAVRYGMSLLRVLYNCTVLGMSNNLKISSQVAGFSQVCTESGFILILHLYHPSRGALLLNAPLSNLSEDMVTFKYYRHFACDKTEIVIPVSLFFPSRTFLLLPVFLHGCIPGLV